MRLFGGGTRVLFTLLLSSQGLLAGPIFSFTLGGGITVGDKVYNGFNQAAARWSSLLTDNVTIRLTIGYKSLGSGILGSTSGTFYDVSDSLVKAALAADAKSADDATAVSHLQSAGSNSFVINHTNNCGDCSTPYLSTGGNFDNSHVSVTGAQARALGLVPGTFGASDGEIDFSSNFTFDFDPSNGINSGAFDFVGVATHEIGHLLGFVSTVDDYDFCGYTRSCVSSRSGTALSENEDDPTVLDYFRFSTDSGFGTRMDQSSDNRSKYFSIDGGTTLGPLFSNGTNFGDGRQASHWKDNLGLGIMDPTSAPGELLGISRNDIRALDVIGWDVATPEPGTTGLLGVGLMTVVVRLRRTRRNVI